MGIERRKQVIGKDLNPREKGVDLPGDYLKLVEEVFSKNFSEGLKLIQKAKKGSKFRAFGKIFSDEIIFGISIVHGKELAATTLYASADFDPTASKPTAEDLLSVCVDAAGGFFAQLMDFGEDPESPESVEKLDKILKNSLSALENVPFDWTPVDVAKRKVFLRVDKSNPMIDQMTDEWLEKNDPSFRELEEEDQREVEDRFIVSPAVKKPKK